MKLKVLGTKIERNFKRGRMCKVLRISKNLMNIGKSERNNFI